MNGVGPVQACTSCTYISYMHSDASTIPKALSENWVVIVQHCGKQRSWRPRSRTTWLLGYKESLADFPHHYALDYASLLLRITRVEVVPVPRPRSPSVGLRLSRRRRQEEGFRGVRDCWNGQIMGRMGRFKRKSALSAETSLSQKVNHIG